MSRRRAARAGFTLVEVMITVLIVAILAGAVIPRLEGSTTDAKDSILRSNLATFRRQIEYFKAQHKGRPPGFDDVHMLYHLLISTNEDGQIASEPDADHPYGPYFSISNLCQNPFNGGYHVQYSTDPDSESPDESLEADGMIVGFFYNVETGQISANAEGNTADGTPRVKL